MFYKEVKISFTSKIDYSFAIKITFDDFKSASKSCCGGNPTSKQYNSFEAAESVGNIGTKLEMAMFVAQVLHESACLKSKVEYKCKKNEKLCAHYEHKHGFPGKIYYGRGYIQLTHSENYKKASTALFGDNRLLRKPEQVANNEEIAWKTAFWYWKVRVHKLKGVQSGNFGSSTRGINGGECTKTKLHHRAKRRFTCFKKVLKALRMNDKAIEKGCYN
ncbi:hypothetical protein B4U80_00992 [Leptotrombidium deliense]|uniref:Glycoside hydrolase family 19 catalytic domain-containing protein n=1 Tax=Leptotrombidium deliense TaxID=299467 RepID=A0A443S0F2_9ACAR|nr:hypothetical protein B4U80_00992 [Leptotrombidium deliense]